MSGADSSSSNDAGRVILTLCSRGNAIIAELHRLADYIPPQFRFNPSTARQLAILFPDFTYLSTSELCEKRIQSDPELLERDASLRDSLFDIVQRFYLLFESIYKYSDDLVNVITDLQDGVFVHQSLETMMIDFKGRQLLVEALYLYGCMLLLIDQLIEGPIRERLLIAYHRYQSDQVAVSNMVSVCQLLQSTGYLPDPKAKRPDNYPEAFFARQRIPVDYVSFAIERLCLEDIYNTATLHYQRPEHRSAALSAQAAMMYVILYFAPGILNTDHIKMREIITKHFPRDWVIPYHMGISADLTEAWQPYKAASSVLLDTLKQEHIVREAKIYGSSVEKLNRITEQYLSEGTLSENYILDNSSQLLNHLRDCNVTIRWLLLHTNTTDRRLRKIVEQSSGINISAFADAGAASGNPSAPVSAGESALIQLLLNTAQLEFLLRGLFGRMLARKKDRWQELITDATSRLKELSEYFSGEKALTRVEKNANLQEWFLGLARQIELMDPSNATASGRFIDQLIKAIDQVLELHQLDTDLTARAFMIETKHAIVQMMRTINIRSDILTTIEVVADVSYIWGAIAFRFVPIFQDLTKRAPSTVIKLRALFLKLVSILSKPLAHIEETKSSDIVSVSEYYSGELVEYARKVLQVIPREMFTLLRQIVELQTTQLRDVPVRLDKDILREAAQLDERYRLAGLTHSVAVFTEGMLAMERTLVGVIEVDPSELLEEGIRRELVDQVTRAMNQALVFPAPGHSSRKLDTFDRTMLNLRVHLNGFQRSFEYIQDYLNIYAFRIWQEELFRIIHYYVERECNTFLRKQISSWDSIYQSREIPIPHPDSTLPGPDGSVNFIGRLAREVMYLTDPMRAIYVPMTASWYDRNSKDEVFSLRSFNLLIDAIGSHGVTGLSRLYGFMSVRALQSFMSGLGQLNKQDARAVASLNDTSKQLEPLTRVVATSQRPLRFYAGAVSAASKAIALVGEVVTSLGHLQILRRQLARELSVQARLEATSLNDVRHTLDASTMTAVRRHYQLMQASSQTDVLHPYPGNDDHALLFELAEFAEASGAADPLAKILTQTVPLPLLPFLIFLYVLSQMQRLTFDPVSGSLLGKGRNSPDGSAIIVGVMTLLRQFHSETTLIFLAYVGQYIRTVFNLVANATPEEQSFGSCPPEVPLLMEFTRQFAQWASISDKTFRTYIPDHVAHCFRP